MREKISPKIVVLTFSILALCFLAAFYVVAWQEPTQAPPGGNVAAPINVGTQPQAKAGRISATEFYDYNDPSYYLNPSGQSVLQTLCLSADCRTAWPAAEALTHKLAVESAKVAGQYWMSKYVEYTCPEGTKPAVTYCKQQLFYPNPATDPLNVFNGCSCTAADSKLTLKAKVYKSWVVNEEQGFMAGAVVDVCNSSDAYRTYYCETSSCEAEFQCNEFDATGGVYGPPVEECGIADRRASGADCDPGGDNTYCNNTCTGGGWDHGEALECTPRYGCSGGISTRFCGINTNWPAMGGVCGACEDCHGFTCRCWND